MKKVFSNSEIVHKFTGRLVYQQSIRLIRD